MNIYQKVLSACALAFCLVLSGCGDPTPPPPPAPTAAEKTAALSSSIELMEEQVYFVTLRFEKVSYSFELEDHIGNWLSTVDKTIIVGPRSYNEYQVGKAVSTKFDWAGALFNDQWATYHVSTVKKEIHKAYSSADKSGKRTQISEQEYNEKLASLRSEGREVLSVPFDGSTRNFVLDKPLKDYEVTGREPLKRYFINVHVENVSFSFDPVKHLRNMANSHELTLEVSKEVYETKSNAWNASMNLNSFLWSGNIGAITGSITKRWTETDSKFELVHTKEGRDLIVGR